MNARIVSMYVGCKGTGCSTKKWTFNLVVNISRQMLFVMVLLV